MEQIETDHWDEILNSDKIPEEWTIDDPESQLELLTCDEGYSIHISYAIYVDLINTTNTLIKQNISPFI